MLSANFCFQHGTQVVTMSMTPILVASRNFHHIYMVDRSLNSGIRQQQMVLYSSTVEIGDF